MPSAVGPKICQTWTTKTVVNWKWKFVSVEHYSCNCMYTVCCVAQTITDDSIILYLFHRCYRPGLHVYVVVCSMLCGANHHRRQHHSVLVSPLLQARPTCLCGCMQYVVWRKPSQTTTLFCTCFTVATGQGPDFQKILGKILSLAQVFPKFMLSSSKVIKLRFSQNFKFNSLLQY